MPRIRRGGGRLRAGGGRTHNEDCCCHEPVTCANIMDTTWRSAREISYEIFNITLSSGCSGTCASSYNPAGVLPYDGSFSGWPGGNYSWHTRTALTCNTCAGSQCYYHIEGRLSCFAGVVGIGLVLRVNRFDGTAGSMWDVGWSATMAAGAFSLGNTYTLSGPTANINGGPCQPAVYLGSTAEVTFS